jgi:hypothetical protein
MPNQPVANLSPSHKKAGGGFLFSLLPFMNKSNEGNPM